jgi:pimeloyl-ACP methyl ester carboxylesterase
MPHSSVNGVELYYEVTGTAGEPLVLVHGSWGDHHNWDAVVPALARSFRVVTYDRRGHSQSERPSGQGSVREDVGDLAALVEHLGLAPAHLVGNSFGAAIVLRLATERPELFRTLTAHEPALPGLLGDDPANGPLVAAVQERVGGVVERLSAGDTEGGARFFVEELAFGPGAWAQIPPELRRTFIANAPTFLDETQDPEAATMPVGALADFSHPALLTQGDQSPPMFARILDIVAAAMPRAERRTIAGVGHVPHVTHPERYVQLVSEFIQAATETAG